MGEEVEAMVKLLMQAIFRAVQFLPILLASISCSALEPPLVLRVHIPKEFTEATAQTPNGQSESSRYRETYAAFWLNCVMVKPRSLALDCPFIASGTPAAAQGALDGTTNAENQIKGWLRQSSPAVVRQYLGNFVSAPDVVKKIANSQFKGNISSE